MNKLENKSKLNFENKTHIFKLLLLIALICSKAFGMSPPLINVYTNDSTIVEHGMFYANGISRKINKIISKDELIEQLTDSNYISYELLLSDNHEVVGKKISYRDSLIILNGLNYNIEGVNYLHMKGSYKFQYLFKSISVFGAVGIIMGLLLDGAECLDGENSDLNSTILWTGVGVGMGAAFSSILIKQKTIGIKVSF